MVRCENLEILQFVRTAAKEFVAGVIRKGNLLLNEDRKEDMICYGCSIKFTMFKRKRQCMVCKRYYCKECLPILNDGSTKHFNAVLSQFTERKAKCNSCQKLTARPLNKNDLLQLHSRDLKNYLSSQNVSTKGCLEKDELVNLLISHVAAENPNSQFAEQDRTRMEQSGVNSVFSPGMPLYNQNVNSDSFPTSDSVHQSSSRGPNIEHLEPEYRVSSPSTNSDDSFVFVADNGLDTHTVHAEVNGVVEIEEMSNCSEDGIVPTRVDIEPDAEEPSEEENIEQAESCPDPNLPENVSESIPDGLPEDVTEETCSQTTNPVKLSDIRNAEELESLTVKQLKEMLYLNRVDFRGCCEKAELVERATRLWNEASLAKTELESLSINELCKICMDAPVECVMLECGHMATCTTCGKQLHECPICRQYVVRIVRTFKA